MLNNCAEPEEQKTQKKQNGPSSEGPNLYHLAKKDILTNPFRTPHK